MAISNIKQYKVKPYHDDFDETKNYHRILFRPGFAVQARELTQLQTALQAQIDKLGQYTFKDGDRVLDGKLSLYTDYHYVKLENTHSSNAVSNVNLFVGTTVTGGTTGLTAEVLHAVAESSGDPITLYLKYTNSGTNQEKVFTAGETITSDADVAKSATVGGDSGSSIANQTGVGSSVSISEGVYFISGNMVHVPKETLILDKYTNTPTYIIGLSITESIKSSADSGYTDLVDNAQGTSNESAPGANRYVIETQLIKEDINLASRVTDDYIHLMTVNNGIVFKKNENPVDTELSTRLETRTSEESGDYITGPFILDIKEHLNDEIGNNGYLIESQGGDDDKIAIGVEPSVAYIAGRRVEKTGTEHIVLDKTRAASDEFVIPETIQSIGFGNFLKLDKNECEGIPDINSLIVIDLKNSGGTDIGTCRARGLEFDSAEDVFRLYVFDVTMDSGQAFGSVAKLSQGTTFEANLAAGALGKRFDTGNNSLVFPLPATSIKTLKDGSNHTADIDVRVRLSGQSVSGGSVTFGLPSGTTLSNDDDVIFHSGSLGDNQDAFEVADTNVSGVAEANITISGLTAYNGEAAVIVCTVRKLNAQAKTKTKILNATTTITYDAAQSVYPLAEVDILGIKTITDSSGNDYADRFLLDNGQRESFYDIGNVILKGGESLPAGNYTVTFDCL